MANAVDVARVLKAGAEDKTSSKRLVEIMGILRRAKVTHGITPERLVEIVEELGPTFIKMGQVLSSRSDMLPQEYCDALKSLRSNTTPEPFETIAERLNDALDGDYTKVFSEISETPLGSASIAQVHRAKLRKSGKQVAVKVLRSHVREDMLRDIELMRRGADLLDLTGVPGMGSMTDGIDFNAIIGELERTVRDEIDFEAESRNIIHLYNFIKRDKGITCPKVYVQYSSETVLIMEFVEGISVEHVDALKACGYDLEEIGNRIAANYMRQMLEEGFYHADPHAANIIIRPANPFVTATDEAAGAAQDEGFEAAAVVKNRASDFEALRKRHPDAAVDYLLSLPENLVPQLGTGDPGEVVWIDCGMMGELSNHERTLFVDMMKAMTDGDSHRLTDLFIEWGSVSDEPGKRLNYGKLLQDLEHLVERYTRDSAENIALTPMLNDIMKILESAHVIMPQSFVTLIRGLATLQGMLITLSPDISIFKVVEEYLAGYTLRTLDVGKETEKRIRKALMSADRGLELPERIANVLDMVEKGRLKMNMDIPDASQPIGMIGPIADRLTLGIVTAGLFIGSSLIYSAGMNPQLFGIPVMGFFGYAGAMVLSIYIVVDMRRRPRR
ncbi:ABC1 kinase family protein [Slackia heliotrinireducens]|uniref:ABC1 kinase family protein n=1 Tax=Slackia heliotrinireducens TaxID=84110 RepID=UPI003315E2F5